MPRQGVPYPSREICSLKCQIDALQRQINELMKSINGVEGDGQGNISLISGDPAIVINNDAAQNQIEISLDPSELPAADVSSVNSQTGAVVLAAADIISQAYNRNIDQVLTDIYIFAAQIRTSLNNEIYRSTNADNTMQTNFNALQASIPGEAANAVANDPTVIQLATDVPNKLDKITSGSALKAYTHTGATQGEKSVVDGTTADSIAIRDANGRLQAADPASGATDKTLVTSNWVSQTGDNGPNNLVHRTGNETIDNIKTFNYNTERMIICGPSSNTDFWVKIARWTAVPLRYGIVMSVVTQYYRDVNFYGKLMFGCWDRTNFAHLDLFAYYDWSSKFKLTWDGSELVLWYHNTSGSNSQNPVIFIEIEWAGTGKAKAAIPIDPANQVAQAEPDWSTYSRVVSCDFKG